MMIPSPLTIVAILILAAQATAAIPKPTRAPLGRAIELNVGESAELTLCDGSRAKIRVLALDEKRDPLASAVREAKVKVEVNGAAVDLVSANYRLPVTAGGVRIDCPITRGYTDNSTRNSWALVDKDVRLRVWPANSPLLEPGTFRYPARQKWFASLTQMANEPVYVDAALNPGRPIYYHDGLDFGGAEGLVEVVSATNALIVSVGEQILPGCEGTPAQKRYDVVYTLDDRGWFYRYSHLHTIDAALKPGDSVKQGQRIGLLGKEGASGGWSHLHFGISAMQPSGKYGTEEAYAYAWEAYVREQKPKLIAVARPHQVVRTGDVVKLDASRSWAATKIARYEWTFGDGSTARGPIVERTYAQPGTCSEILKVTDDAGNVAYDFAYVRVHDLKRPELKPPGIHAVYYPTTGVKPGDPITFKVRAFHTTAGQETWDFGDGTPQATTRSDGNVKALAKDGYAIIEHRYAKPGGYLVRVERANEQGLKAVGRLHVVVE